VYELLVGIQINSVLYVFLAEKLSSIALNALKAVWAFPIALWNLDKLRFKAPIVIDLVTHCADQKAFPLFGRVAFLTKDAVVAPPVLLKASGVLLRVRQAIGVETFATKVAGKEVVRVAKGTAKIAHLSEDQRWIFKTDL
jgi:hypothetical protein